MRRLGLPNGSPGNGWGKPRIGSPTSIAAQLTSPGSIWRSPPVRWIIAASIAASLLIVAAVAALLWDLRNEQVAKTQRSVETLALVLSEQIDRSFQSIELVQTGLLERITGLDIVSPEAFKHQMSGLEVQRRLMGQILALQHVDALVLIDADGNLINYTRGWPIPPIRNTSLTDAFKADPALVTILDKPRRSPANGDWVMSIARKVNGPDGEFLGVIVGTMKLQYFKSYFRSVVGAEGQSIALFHGDATLIAHYPGDDSLRGRSLADRQIFRLLSAADHGTVRQESMTGRGQLLISGRKLAHYPLSVVITQRLDSVMATWRYAEFAAAGGSILIVILIVGLALLIARKVWSNLQTQTLLLDTALNNMVQGVAMFDPKGRLIVCNERFPKMYGIPRETIRRGVSLRELLAVRYGLGTYFPGEFETPEKFTEYLMQRIAQGESLSLTQVLPDGRFISVNNTPMPDGSWVATHEDITESQRREESFRLLFERNPVPMWVFDRETFRFLAVNNAAVAHYGYSREQFMSMSTLAIRPPEERNRLIQRTRVDSEDKIGQQCWRHLKADGAEIEVNVYARSLEYEGRPGRLVAAHDITDRYRAEEELRRTKKFLDTIVENVPVPILVKDVPPDMTDVGDCRYTFINRACEDLFGVSRDHIVGKTPRDIYPPERAEFVISENRQALASEEPLVMTDHAVETPKNGLRYAVARTFAVRDDDQRPRYLLTVLEDVTERRRWEQRLSRMAHFDALSDLPNRTTFNDALQSAIERAARDEDEVTVLSLDLDGFKEANDTYGHAVGDALLCEVAQRLLTAAGSAFVARLGGDEFAVIISRDSGANTEEVAERILRTLSQDILVEDRKISVGASIGAALYPKDGVDAKTLMINADLALYRAKAEARGTLLYFDAEMAERVRDRRALQSDLVDAIAKNELSLHYQPQKSMNDETIGFEALLRWHSPTRGMVPPSEFIPIAEASGLIGSIGEWVLREACREAASWPASLQIAVNISPMQFRDRDLAGTVHAILLETGLSPSRLELEITESVLIDDLSRAVSVLYRLKVLGVRIALDDFGTGYSSLSYLHAFSFDKIKIDRTFIGDLEQSHHARAIVRAVIDLGHSLKVPILAEGVETAAQHVMLEEQGCDEVQGYFTGRPRPIEDYAVLVGRPPVRRRAAG